MAELIQLITDQGLTRPRMPWAIPQAVLQQLGSATYKGKPVVSAVRYFPSRQSQLYKKFVQLDEAEKALLRAVVADSGMLESEAFNRTPHGSQIRVLDTLTDYYRFLTLREELQQNPSYNAAVLKRFKLASGTTVFHYSADGDPQKGHSPSYSSLGYSHSERFGDGIALRFRPAYYDQLDAGYGHVPGSTLSMLDFGVSVYGDETLVDHLDLVSIENLNPYATQLPGDERHAWSLSLGARKMNNDCEDCLGYMGMAGRGFSTAKYRGNLLLNGMLRAGFKAEKITSDAAFGDVVLRANVRVSERSRILFSVIQRNFIVSGDSETELAAALRYELTRNLDWRVAVEKNHATTVNLSFGWYW